MSAPPPATTVDRKAPCPCKSGKKYKSCCFARDRGRSLALETAAHGAAAVDEVLARR